MSTIEPPSGHKIRAQQEEFNRIADGVDIGVAPFNDQVAEDIEQTLDRHSETSPHTSNPSS